MVPEQVCWEEGLSLSLEKAQSFQIQLEGSGASLPNLRILSVGAAVTKHGRRGAL